MNTDYAKYRGKCKEACEALADAHPDYRIVRGWYDCPLSVRQEHWWCVDQDGTVVDPTRKQFLSKGVGEYIEYKGILPCSQCGKDMAESDIHSTSGKFAFCSYECHRSCVLG